MTAEVNDAATQGLLPEAKAFARRLRAQMSDKNTLLCIGLDPQGDYFPHDLPLQPDHPAEAAEAIVRFNMRIIEATYDLVCAYKLNLGFYLPFGPDGLLALLRTRRLIPAEVPVILDAKVGDIRHTATAYAAAYFDAWGFDAVTVNPYLGEDSLAPFLTHPDRGVIVVTRTSNPSSGQLQNLEVHPASGPRPLFEQVADLCETWDEAYPASVGMVVGATFPDELARVRARHPSLPILLPGIGAQAGDLKAALRAGLDREGMGLLVSPSRSITYASREADYAGQARRAAAELVAAINAIRADLAVQEP